VRRVVVGDFDAVVDIIGQRATDHIFADRADSGDVRVR
jgi:hypothetical protein